MNLDIFCCSFVAQHKKLNKTFLSIPSGPFVPVAFAQDLR
jgi:hypothetical protein